MNDCVVEVSNVSVKYVLSNERPRTFQEYLINLISGRTHKKKDFWAVRGITFSVLKGESLGIIGSNGSGKSTLLKIIAGIIRPTEGEAVVRGKIAPMIELGAGFDSELTGRENIYLNASILGLSRKEIDAKFDRIVEFAGIGDFLHSPLRSYSSGMLARLAFSIAVEVEAEILVVDEVLSVGDEGFRRKCHERIDDLIKKGSTIIYVSHSISEVQRLCEKVVWIEHGAIVASGDADIVTRKYILYFDGTAFDDIAAGHPYKKYIDAMFLHGISVGYNVNGRRYYNPDNKVSRAEFAVYLSKALGMKKTYTFRQLLRDVTETHWAARHISWVCEGGFIEPARDDSGNMFFYPDEYLTVADTASVFSKINSEKWRTVLSGERMNRAEIARIFYDFFDYREFPE